MKKTLVALAVAAVAATSANAAVVYDQDGSKVEVGGSLRLLLTKNSGERGDLKNKGSRVVIKGSQDLGNGLSALGNVEVRFEGNKGDDFGDIETKRLFAGFKQDGVGQLTFGRQLTNADDLGLSDYTYDLGGVNQTTTSGRKVAKFTSAEWNGFKFGLDYIFDNSAKQDSAQNRGWGASVFYTADLGSDITYNFSGGFTQDKYKKQTISEATTINIPNAAGDIVTVPGSIRTSVPDHKENAFIVSSELVTGPFAISVDYSQRKSTNDVNLIKYRAFSDTVSVANFNKITEIGLGMKYSYLENASVYGEYIWGQGKLAKVAADVADKANLRAWILGTDYKLHKNVVTYLEGGSFKYKYASNKNTDNYAGVGLRVYF